MSLDKYKDKGLTGLANLGNTCFLNSTMQCLSHCYELNNFLIDGNFQNKLNKNSEALMLIEWNNLRELMWSENCTISPGRFVSTIQKIAKVKDKSIFTGFAQNDLPEFLLFIIDGFHESVKRSVTMNINGNARHSTDHLALKCYKMLQNMYEKHYSEIIQLFYGSHVSQVTDISGVVLSQTPEPFFLLNLPIPKNANPTLLDCFDIYTKKELLEGENAWYNEKTKEKQSVMKQITFFSLPDILVIDLKRFSNNLRKNNVYIDIPLENLDLSTYIIGYEKDTYVYDLFGVCNHNGSIIGGHYTANVKNANGKWYNFNDTQVTEINDTKVITPLAYCLFYRKKK